jgi:hypothetical protein
LVLKFIGTAKKRCGLAIGDPLVKSDNQLDNQLMKFQPIHPSRTTQATIGIKSAAKTPIKEAISENDEVAATDLPSGEFW